MKANLVTLSKLLLQLAVPAVGVALLVVAGFFLYLSPKLPSPETLRTVRLQTPLRVYSADSELIAEFGEQRRTPIGIEDIPPTFIQALLAAEDDNFYNHGGVDIKGLVRAAFELARTGQIQSGGSTITMQLARNFFLTTEQTFIRKFNEILLALRIERKLDKDEILTLYANKIFLGHRAYGVEAAAQVYYGQSIDDLGLPQLAMIAGLPKAPSAYNPLSNPSRALARRNWILGRMHQLGYIDKSEFEAAVAAPVIASYHGPTSTLNAPYVAEMARREALDRLGPAAYTDGYRVITTVDSGLQRKAIEALRKGLHAYDKRHGFRGPEKHIPDPGNWEAALRNTPMFGGLMPAIVTAVDEDSASFRTRTGDTLTLTMDDGLAGIRRFLSPSRYSTPASKATTLLDTGDLVRLGRNQDEDWYLTQVPRAQAALVSLDPDSGAIAAIVGGYDFNLSHYNRATQAERQPGSNFKPFLYTHALERGMTPATLINDAPVVFDDPGLEQVWRPENYSGRFYGPTPLRQALYLSRNLVSIRVLREIGIDSTIDSLGRFGFDESSVPRNLSLALGTLDVTPLNLANGFTAFANGGYRVHNHLVARIEDSDGTPVYRSSHPRVCRDCDNDSADTEAPEEQPPAVEAASLSELLQDEDTRTPTPEELMTPAIPLPPPPAERILDPRIAYIMDSILKDVISRGTGRKARALERDDIAGKTGTTNGPRDAWFSGYSPHLSTTVWLGFDDNQVLGSNEYGGSAALPIWIDFMETALRGKPEIIWPQPSGVVTARINPDTGHRVGPGHPNGVFELFLRENVPPMADGQEGGNEDSRSVPDELF